MKPAIRHRLLTAALLAAGLAATVSQAAVFTYDSSVGNWYSNWTATDPGVGYIPSLDPTYTDRLRITGVGVSQIPGTAWSGAQWTIPSLPAGEYITSVTLTYSGVINGYGAPNLTVYAGTTPTALSKVFTNTVSLGGGGTSATIPLSYANQYTTLMVRNWDADGTSGYALSPAWNSTVSSISITTIPEPAALSLLALGGCCLLRRRRG